MRYIASSTARNSYFLQRKICLFKQYSLLSYFFSEISRNKKTCCTTSYYGYFFHLSKVLYNLLTKIMLSFTFKLIRIKWLIYSEIKKEMLFNISFCLSFVEYEKWRNIFVCNSFCKTWRKYIVKKTFISANHSQ